MMRLPNITGLEGLLDLNRQGVDIRPTLLRVLTDQYLHSPLHSADEERQYTELALRLLNETDAATRLSVAKRLAPHAETPRPIVQQLARDVLMVAEPILLQSPCLTPADLSAIAEERGDSYAAIIARRSQTQPEDISAPRNDPKHPPVEQSRYRASQLAPLPEQSADLPAEASELCELFFTAGALERRLILTSLDYAITPAPEPSVTMKRTDVWRLESAALQHNTEAVVRDLERALGLSRQQAMRVVDDELGEPIVAAAKAMELPADVLQRILLFMNPRVGQSVDRVYDLAALHLDITVDAARRLVAIWRDADPREERSARSEGLWQDTVHHARQALSEITRRAPTPRDSIRPDVRQVAIDKR
jgi:uncharacterized protein (DUF2336 family)